MLTEIPANIFWHLTSLKTLFVSHHAYNYIYLDITDLGAYLPIDILHNTQ